MTVKSLTPLQKKNIVYQWQSHQMNMKQLAAAYSTSSRTIQRVLIEAGVATHQERYQGMQYAIYQLTVKHQVTYNQLKKILEDFTSTNKNKPIANTQQLPLLLDKNNKVTIHDPRTIV